MSKVFSLEELVPVLKETLEVSGEVSFASRNDEMKPIIRGNGDAVTLIKPKEKLKKGDVVLYKRENGEYVLRRIVFVNKDTYVACGDNERTNEYKIADEQILGMLLSYDRNGKTHKTSDTNYKIYVFLLPVIKLLISGYKWLKERVINFIKFLFKK